MRRRARAREESAERMTAGYNIRRKARLQGEYILGAERGEGGGRGKEKRKLVNRRPDSCCSLRCPSSRRHPWSILPLLRIPYAGIADIDGCQRGTPQGACPPSVTCMGTRGTSPSRAHREIFLPPSPPPISIYPHYLCFSRAVNCYIHYVSESRV